MNERNIRFCINSRNGSCAKSRSFTEFDLLYIEAAAGNFMLICTDLQIIIVLKCGFYKNFKQ